jgi:hypothetical protein
MIKDTKVHISTTDKIRFGRPIFVLDHPYHYDNDKLTIIVPEGFETDFASIPLIFGLFLPSAHPKWSGLAVVHDYCYGTGCVPRNIADSVFLDHWKKAPVRILFIYCAVRLFGWIFYKKKKNDIRDSKMDC